MKLTGETTLTVRYNLPLLEAVIAIPSAGDWRRRGRPTPMADAMLRHGLSRSLFRRSEAALRLDALWGRAIQLSGEL